MTKKQIIMQGLMASAVVAVIGISGNMVMQDRALAVQARTVSVIVDEASELQPPTDVRVRGEVLPSTGIAPRERARIEHGEPHEGISPGEAPPGADGVHEFELGDPIPMEEEERSIAIKRLEDIYVRLDEPEVPNREREMLEMEKHGLLVRHFPPAGAAAKPPIEVKSEPFTAPVEESWSAFITPEYVFNKVWQLLQALIVAWVAVRFQSLRKRERANA